MYCFDGLGVDFSAGHPVSGPDVPKGETPKRTPSPMILGIEALISLQEANT
jgi:hypothetical protein